MHGRLHIVNEQRGATMRRARLYVIPVFGLLAAAETGCAGAQQPTPAEQAQQNLDQAQKNLDQARQREKQAAEQQKDVTAAHEQTVKAQQQLAEAQKKEEEKRASAQRLQQQANQQMQQANQQAQAATAPRQGGFAAEGQRTISGHLLQANPSQIVLQAQDGRTITVDIDDRTRVLIGGEQRSAADLQRGADVRVAYVAYQDASGRPTAVTIEVPSAGTRSPPGPDAGTTASPMPGSDDSQRTGD
jgi:Skp family chaperone for outer membrane proteins